MSVNNLPSPSSSLSSSPLPPDDLDGFPTFSLLSETDDSNRPLQNNDDDDDDDGNGKRAFVSDFYSSGTDWSCLLPSDESRRGGRLKQANLFQIWGFSKPPVPKSPSDDRSPPPPLSSSSLPPPKKHKMAPAIELKPSRSDVLQRPNHHNRPRLCPFYKKIPGTPFAVDAFRYGHIDGCSAYFLTHFHSDHYGGLTKGWSHGPIYCTLLTARLIRMCVSVNPLFIHPLEFNVEHVVQGIKVTMLEANHCPGAALILFRLPNGQNHLHTGDFRACKAMQAYPVLVNQRVNVLYLDTTYCNPKYKFPSKEDVLSFVVRVTANFLKKQPKTLVIVGAYSIGKECVYLSISEALGVKIYVNASRKRILQSFGWPALSESLCSDGKDSLLHVLPISFLRFEYLKQYLKTYADQYTMVLAFRPTGWTYSEAIGNQLDLIKPNSRGNITIYGVPYSEHSSFTELREFVQFLKPDRIIPTVNVGNAVNRDKMQSYFREWLKAGVLGRVQQ
ncbi:DNA cross-link repair protein SNM1 [Malania oleifera]|uniref:DNA cross-link repair protein SNM1 n=1 Tax=Malania oleifera TaxID=397392 RepID=UPI0025AEA0D2|nr:DNA cross-link repair protein SNM1 [Malania oleifera]